MNGTDADDRTEPQRASRVRRGGWEVRRVLRSFTDSEQGRGSPRLDAVFRRRVLDRRSAGYHVRRTRMRRCRLPQPLQRSITLSRTRIGSGVQRKGFRPAKLKTPSPRTQSRARPGRCGRPRRWWLGRRRCRWRRGRLLVHRDLTVARGLPRRPKRGVRLPILGNASMTQGEKGTARSEVSRD